MTPPTPSGAIRTAVLVDHPAHYFASAYRQLASQPEIDLTVYYRIADTSLLHDPGFGRSIQWATDLHDGYRWWAPTGGSQHSAGPRLLRQLRRDRPDILICHGWGSQHTLIGALYALATNTSLLFYGDTNGRAANTSRIRRVKTSVLRTLLRLSSGVISTGTANREFYLANGVDEHRIHPGVLPVDVTAFTAASESVQAGAGANDDVVTVTYVGKLIDLKAVDDLINAMAAIRAEPRWRLWVIGDGPKRSQLVDLAAHRGITDRCHFLGFVNTDRLPGALAQTDIFVLPSHQESRGLAAIEAMAAGAAVVVSSATGVWGSGDAIEHGLTGLVYPAGDITRLADAVRSLVADPFLRRRLGVAATAAAQEFGPARYSTTTAAAVGKVAGRCHLSTQKEVRNAAMH